MRSDTWVASQLFLLLDTIFKDKKEREALPVFAVLKYEGYNSILLNLTSGETFKVTVEQVKA